MPTIWSKINLQIKREVAEQRNLLKKYVDVVHSVVVSGVLATTAALGSQKEKKLPNIVFYSHQTPLQQLICSAISGSLTQNLQMDYKFSLTLLVINAIIS